MGPMGLLLQRRIHSHKKLRHGISLGICLVFMGWVLALYHLPLWAWGLTLMSLIHLSKSGRGAIPLALTWITLMIWVAAYKYAAPVGFVWRNPKYWSASLICLWGMATVLVLALAKVPILYPRQSDSALKGVLPAILMSCGMGCGVILYHQGLAPQ